MVEIIHKRYFCSGQYCWINTYIIWDYQKRGRTVRNEKPIADLVNVAGMDSGTDKGETHNSAKST
ncbi:MAG: hypothetical protein ACLTW9_30700, partial [Enterocloster sp.]